MEGLDHISTRVSNVLLFKESLVEVEYHKQITKSRMKANIYGEQVQAPRILHMNKLPWFLFLQNWQQVTDNNSIMIKKIHFLSILHLLIKILKT